MYLSEKKEPFRIHEKHTICLRVTHSIIHYSVLLKKSAFRLALPFTFRGEIMRRVPKWRTL